MQTTQHNPQFGNWTNIRNLLLGGVVSFVIGVVGNLVATIISESREEIDLFFARPVDLPPIDKLSFILMVGGMLLVSIAPVSITTVLWYKASRKLGILEAANKLATTLNQLDTSLQTILQSENMSQDILDRSINIILSDISKFFDFQCRVSVLEPDGDKLIIKHCQSHTQLAPLHVGSTFFIGEENNDSERGLAGWAYKKGETLGTTLKKGKEYWYGEDPRFKSFNLYPAMQNPPFVAVIAIPILNAENGKRLGVLCLDSQDKEMFSSEQRKQILKDFATRLASTFTMRRWPQFSAQSG